MTTENIDIDLLRSNRGQLDAVPANPRFIADKRFDKLVQSVEQHPEFLQFRPCIVVKKGGIYVVIAGNMRYRACERLQFETVPCIVLSEDTPAETLRAYTIKDNIAFGSDDFDVLANEWDESELESWGMESWEKPEKGKTRMTIETTHTCPNCGNTW